MGVRPERSGLFEAHRKCNQHVANVWKVNKTVELTSEIVVRERTSRPQAASSVCTGGKQNQFLCLSKMLDQKCLVCDSKPIMKSRLGMTLCYVLGISFV